jgi:nucleoside-diphosphate-sugar epimerase
VSKYAAERYCRMFHQGHGWPIVMLRPSNTYGPAQSPDRIIPEIIVRALRGEPIRMTQGRQTREFIYVEDLAEALVRAGTAPGIDGEVINIGCGEEVSMRDLAIRLLGVMGNPIEPQFGAIPDRPTEVWRMFSDNAKAKELLGWAPAHSLEDGLSRTIEWYKAELGHRGSSFAV